MRRLAVFLVGLALIGGVAALAGSAIGGDPVEATAAPAHDEGMEEMTAADMERANGLATGAGGYTFVPERTALTAGKTSTFRFRIVDAEGNTARRFDLDGGVRMHLIVVRRDFVGYQHLHPTAQTDGSWSVPLRLPSAGAYRAFADFEAAGKKTVVGHDLFAPGSFAPARLPAVSRTAAVDGYSVQLAHDELRAGKETELSFVVSRNGNPVPSFQTYVGQRGHLVALRDGDLAYSHVHPLPEGGTGEIVYHMELPASGSYRLFLQFKRNGVVHTAPFTVTVAR